MSSVNWTPWHNRLHRQLLMQPELLPEGSTLLLAVSGGQDSMAMLALLQDLVRLHHWNLQIWHGDHGWHGDSARIAAELGSWCRNRGLIWITDQAGTNHASSEASARNWRYGQLSNHARLLNSDVVTGHTASDRAETQLLQLARGTDLAGMGSLRAIRPLQAKTPDGAQLRRPMLGFSREETARICEELTLPIWHDPSNASAAHARNRIRHEVLPVLEELYPGCSLRMAAMAERFSQVQDTQAELCRQLIDMLVTENGLKRHTLASLSLATRRLLLANWLQRHGVPSLSASQLTQLSHHLAMNRSGRILELGSGWMLQIQNGLVRLRNATKQN